MEPQTIEFIRSLALAGAATFIVFACVVATVDMFTKSPTEEFDEDY